MDTLRMTRPGIDWMPSILIFLAVIAIATLGGLATDTASAWYLHLSKPSWQPPGWLFGPVWSTIYLLLAISASLVWHAARGGSRSTLMALYGINGALNLAWSFIFFQGHTPLWAGIDIIILWCSILLIMVRAWPVSRAASLLLLPYLLWVSFASVLNWSIVGLN
ncbi:MAG: TspO/MBR family protein [Bacteroidota bacterium]